MTRLRLLVQRTTSPAGRRPAWERWLQLMGGIAIFGLAVPLMIRSGLGLGPWDAFHYGLHRLTGMSVGLAIILVGIVIVGATYLIKVRPGPGTIVNMILIGVFADIAMLFIPAAGSWISAALMFGAGVFLTAFATGMYIGAGLGKGPRDGLMIGISQMTGWKVGHVRTGIEIAVLGIGWAMGGIVGIGTIIFALSIGPATQWSMKLFGMSDTGATREEQEKAIAEAQLGRAA